VSKLTIVADSTQIARFLECPMLWNLEFKENLAAIALPPNDAIMMGSYGHKLMDLFYKATARGVKTADALEQAIAFNPDSEAGEAGFPLSQEKRAIVKQRFVEYVYTYINNDFVPLSPDHVEVGFSEPIYEDASRLYVLEGRIDLIGTYQGLHCSIDHKFQLRAHALYKKSIQFRNYAMVTKTNMFIINYVRLTKGVQNGTFQRDIASFTPLEHYAWKQRLIRAFDKMALALQSETFEQSWDACSGKFGYPCQFTPLCEESDKGLIQLKKQTQFVQKPEWKPW
jgi:hypothetical protein